MAKQKRRPVSGGRAGAVSNGQRQGVANGANTTARQARLQATQGDALSRGAIRRKQAHQSWWQGKVPIFATLGVVVLLIALFAWQASRAQNTPNASIGSQAPASILDPVVKIDAATLATVGTGGLSDPLKTVKPAPSLLLGSTGKAQIFYAGADYCPYCAGERWSLVMALSRFGSFSQIKLMQSSSTDAHPNTPTFSFHDSKYTSQYIDWVPLELSDRDGQPLDTATDAQKSIISTYNTSAYVGSDGSIPFLSFGNQYLASGAGYDTTVLDGLTWDQIANKLSDPHAPVTKGIVGNANYLTAAICQTTKQQPASVCNAAPIPDIVKQLTAGK